MAEQTDGSQKYMGAAATGIGFFKQQNPDQSLEYEQKDLEAQVEKSTEIVDKPINFEEDIEIDFDRSYTNYTRFNGRFQDDNLDIEDIVSVMIPAEPETTNCLQFKLVLLQSDIVPRDYVVGWGVFPLLNSDFALNEGNFKVPLLFGNVNPRIDKYMKIE